MVNKKGQMKIQQMAFMLVGITLFFILVGLFMFSFYMGGIKEEQAKLKDDNARSLVLKLANSPELSCGAAFGTEKTNCIDLDKAMALKTLIGNYENFWSVQGIEIIKVYPESRIKCTKETYPDCGLMIIYGDGESGITKSTFVTACYKKKLGTTFFNKCEIAKLIVRVADE